MQDDMGREVCEPWCHGSVPAVPELASREYSGTSEGGNHSLGQIVSYTCDIGYEYTDDIAVAALSSTTTTTTTTTTTPTTTTTTTGPCRTVSGDVVNTDCVFPFRFGGQTYNGCILQYHEGGEAWCSTSVDGSGTHQSGSSGNCDLANCPLDSSYAPTWHRFAGAQYSYEDEGQVDWYEAQKMCQWKGGQLAAVKSADVQKFLMDTFVELNVNIWLGGTDEANEGTWTWVNDEAWEYGHWHCGTEPNGGDCLAIAQGKNGRWADKTCTTNSPKFICQKGQSTSSGQLAFAEFSGAEYAYRDGLMTPTGCLSSGSVHLTWDEAQQVCADNGARLAAIADSSVLRFWEDSLHLNYDWDMWLGLTDRAVEGTYVWESGDPVSYTNWKSGEPKADSGTYARDCLTMEKDRDWEMSPCDRNNIGNKAFVCQKGQHRSGAGRRRRSAGPDLLEGIGDHPPSARLQKTRNVTCSSRGAGGLEWQVGEPGWVNTPYTVPPSCYSEIILNIWAIKKFMIYPSVQNNCTG